MINLTEQLTMQDIYALHRKFSISTSLIGNSATYSSYQSIHAFGAKRIFSANSLQSLAKLQEFISSNDWYFGVLSYDVKQETEQSKSLHQPTISNLPDIYFFCPEFVITEQNDQFFVHGDVSTLLDCLPIQSFTPQQITIDLHPSISKQDYINTFQLIQYHIHKGNCYEMNYCQEFIQQSILLDTLSLFHSIQNDAPAPYSALLNTPDWSIISASPERFLKKQNDSLISQPIKGTAQRSKNILLDEENKNQLKQSQKEQAEHVMIVDLVRNDFSKICEPGSVKVPELLHIYSYPTVHQMVSTITGKLPINTTFQEILNATFPMGSMTGAPKHSVLELTEQLETFRRGYYSGALGYITPENNFDFNVLIRSFVYHYQQQTLTYGAGSGITTYANAADEYNECLLKVNSLIDKLNS